MRGLEHLQDLEFANAYQAKISQKASQILELLQKNKKVSAMKVLEAFDQRYDKADEMFHTISVIVNILERVLSQPNSRFPRELPPKPSFSLAQQDDLMAKLLSMKVIWISDLYNFSTKIQEGGIAQFKKVKETQAYRVYQAMIDLKEEASSLIHKYFLTIPNEKFKIEMASRMLEDVIYKASPTDASAKAKQIAIAKVLFEHGAQCSNLEALKRVDDKEELTNLAQKEKTAYRYLVG